MFEAYKARWEERESGRVPQFILFYFLDILFDVALILHLHTMLCLIKPALRNFFDHTGFRGYVKRNCLSHYQCFGAFTHKQMLL